MRRAPIVIATTIAGTAGVLAFKPHEPSLAAAIAPASSADPTTPSASGSSSGSSGSSSTGASGSGSSGSSGSAGSSDSGSSSSSGVSGTATGDSIATQYGPVQVKVTVKDGKITNVVPLALTGDDPKSVQISASAAPSLLQSALTKQTAAIDAVSGATITSAGYEASLQSALDKVGFKAADGSRGSSTIPQVQEHGGGGPFGR